MEENIAIWVHFFTSPPPGPLFPHRSPGILFGAGRAGDLGWAGPSLPPSLSKSLAHQSRCIFPFTHFTNFVYRLNPVQYIPTPALRVEQVTETAIGA